MGSWIGVGLGAAAALCPLPQHGDATVVMEHAPTTDRLVVCAPDVWVDMGYGDPGPASTPPSECRPPAPPSPVPPPAPSPPPPAPHPPAPPSPAPPPAPGFEPEPVPAVTPPHRPAPSPARHAALRAVEPKAAERPAEPAPPADPEPGTTPASTSSSTPAPIPAEAPAKVRQAFRWVPRLHYTGGPTRPAPAGLSTTMTTVVVTLPGVLAAAALRPGSRRRNRG
ncbi:hypothetical protein ACIGG5_25320 [Streptomyces sp. NPDC085463]|uniref:hypothetical protein n=1 Tax=Streptomyces sp. NPDC085463 TaxID=3365724 RepID=UPI0037D430AE